MARGARGTGYGRPGPRRGLRWRLRWLRRTDAYAAAPLRLPGRAARFTLSELVRRDITFTTPDGLTLRTMRNTFSSFAMCTVGERDPEMCRFIERHVPAGGTFVDAGANIGAWSLAAARCIGPSGRLLAFEAHPRTHGFLRANLDMNGFSDARTFQGALGALGAQEGRIALDLHDANPGASRHAAHRRARAGTRGRSRGTMFNCALAAKCSGPV